MTGFLNFISKCKARIRQERSYQIVATLAGLLLIMVSAEIGLNLLVRQAVRQSLVKFPGPETRLELRMEWLSFGELLTGRIRKVKLKGYQCQISGVQLQQLEVDCNGLTVDLPVLLKDRQFVFRAISATRVTARITEAAATAYFSAKYPQFKPEIDFLPGRLGIAGAADAFGKTVTLRLEGIVRAVQPKTVRFYPEQLQVANHAVSPSFLKYLGDRIPLEVQVLQEWPLRIKDLMLQKDVIVLRISEVVI